MNLIWYHPATTSRDHKCGHVVQNKEIRSASAVTTFLKDQPPECLWTWCLPTRLWPSQWPVQEVFRPLHNKEFGFKTSFGDAFCHHQRAAALVPSGSQDLNPAFCVLPDQILKKCYGQMFWLHGWSWWESILLMNSRQQGVVGHCYGLNPRWNVKLPKYTIWRGLNSPSIKKRISWKKKIWMLYHIPHSAAQGLFATAMQFRWKKKSIFQLRLVQL